MRVESRESKVEKFRERFNSHFCSRLSPLDFRQAFTLIELLAVISILALIAALAVPALKNLGKSNLNISASRQMLDEIGRARQLAMSQRTTVYMVFVPTNFWLTMPAAEQNSPATTNLLDKQLAGYNFYVVGQVGDQPGQHQPHYLLSSWRTLPKGTFIASDKFTKPTTNNFYPVFQFAYTNGIPFPTTTNATIAPPAQSTPRVYYIAFNYLGQLTFDGQNLAPRDEYIPLEHGAVLPAIDSDKNPVLGPAQVSEDPPGNSTSSAYNIIKIDALTGRATLLYQKVQ